MSTIPGGGENPVPPKRSLRSLLVRPNRQLKLVVASLGVAMLAMAGLTGFLVLKVDDLITKLEPSSPEIAAYVQNTLSPALTVVLLGQVLVWAGSIFIGVLVSHRVYGPLIPIVRHIRKLAEGDYASRVRLRKGDELEEVAGALNELAEKLGGKR